MTTPTVTVRYWAAARAAAGVDQETIAAATLGEALDVIVTAHDDARFTQIVQHCAILHGEVPVAGRDPGGVALSEGDVLEFLPPFAGG